MCAMGIQTELISTYLGPPENKMYPNGDFQQEQGSEARQTYVRVLVFDRRL